MTEAREAVQAWIGKLRKEWFEKLDDKQWRNSQWHRYLILLGDEVARLNPDPDSLEYREFWAIERFLGSLGFAASGSNWDAEPSVWKHTKIDLKAIKAGTARYTDLPTLEEAVSEYLELPIRVREIDRCLVDMLVQAEFAQFAKLVHGDFGLWVRGNGPFAWLFWRLASALLLLGSAAVLNSLFDGTWVEWTTAVMVGLFVLETVISLIRLPFAWRAQSLRSRRATHLLEEMAKVYSALNSHSPISAVHIRELAQSTTLEGVVWPASLFVLLDDVIRRDGRI